MQNHLDQTIALLSHTPGALHALLHALPEAWTLRNEGEKTMSVFDVIGHLIYAERTNWIPRIKIVLEAGENQAFPLFDRWGHVKDSEGKSLEQLLQEFQDARSKSLDELRQLNLQPDDFHRAGRHPALGRVTLSELLAAWATHDLTHLHQIARVMAYQNRDAVGPFRPFLGVLKCKGHGS